jgi:hypothetical protein
MFFSAVDGTSSKSSDWNSKRSAVSVINSVGKQRRLKILDTREEAQAEAQRLDAELSELGLEQWCSRHEVPFSFFKV